MLFKGKYSSLLSRKCQRFGIDPSEIDRDFHLGQGNVYTETYGWIKSNEIILELKDARFIKGLQPPEIKADCAQLIERDNSPFFKGIYKELRRFRDKGRTKLAGIESFKICPHNPNFVLIRFNSRDEFHGEIIQRFSNESGIPTGGGNPKNGNESAEISPNGSLGPGFQTYTDADLKGLPGGTNIRRGKDTKSMTVGILDRGHFSEGEPYSHVDVLRKIIEDPGFVNVQNMPMVDDPEGEATTFDMICALSNRKWINRVDLINISQGHYAFAPHPILHKVLKCLDKIIVCSAGNDHLDNDQTGHWPSNFSLNLDHLLGVANVGQALTLHPTSNFGNDSVTIAASGEFGATLFGTSYATAWVSRVIALSYALTGRNDLTLAEIIDKIRQIYQVQFNTSDQTLSKVRFLAVKK